MRNWPTDNSEALAAFIARKTEIDTMLARLAALRTLSTINESGGLRRDDSGV